MVLDRNESGKRWLLSFYYLQLHNKHLFCSVFNFFIGQVPLTNMGIRQMWSDGLSKGHNVRKIPFIKGSCKDPKRYPLMISTNTLLAKYVKVILLMQLLLLNVYTHVSRIFNIYNTLFHKYEFVGKVTLKNLEWLLKF